MTFWMMFSEWLWPATTLLDNTVMASMYKKIVKQVTYMQRHRVFMLRWEFPGK